MPEYEIPVKPVNGKVDSREHQRAYMRQWYLDRKEEIKLAQKERYWKDPEKYRGIARKSARKNPDKCRIAHKKWLDKNPGYSAKKQRERRARDPVAARVRDAKARKLKDRNKVNEYSKKWRAKNPERHSAILKNSEHKRRAAKLACDHPITTQEIQDIRKSAKKLLLLRLPIHQG